MFYYLALNICVNMFDFVWNFALQGIEYQYDDDFVSSFSYKTHQLVLIAILSLISGQFINPTIALFRETPLGLAILHFFSINVSASLFFNFLFELTSMAPKTRFKVFRVELTKVFMTLIVFYFLSLCFTTWMNFTAQSIQ